HRPRGLLPGAVALARVLRTPRLSRGRLPGERGGEPQRAGVADVPGDHGRAAAARGTELCDVPAEAGTAGGVAAWGGGSALPRGRDDPRGCLGKPALDRFGFRTTDHSMSRFLGSRVRRTTLSKDLGRQYHGHWIAVRVIVKGRRRRAPALEILVIHEMPGRYPPPEDGFVRD